MLFNLEGWTEFAFAMLETSKIILIKILSLIFNPLTYTVYDILYVKCRFMKDP